MKPELTLIPAATLNPGNIALYNIPDWQPGRPGRFVDDNIVCSYNRVYSHLISSSRAAAGKVSKIAKRKMIKAINYMLFITNPKKVSSIYSGRSYSMKLAFVTLTLPSLQIHSDNTIKSQCLNQFLIEIKRFHHVKHYIWRAEKQKNGNLHFHVLIDTFIPFQELRDRWNRIINKLGYVDRYRTEQENYHSAGFTLRKELLKTWPADKQKEAYKRGSKNHWNSPNSTDIHSIRKIYNLKQYLIKYITKNEQVQALAKSDNLDITIQEGRIWSADIQLLNNPGCRFHVDSALSDAISYLVNHPKSETFTSTYFTIVYFDTETLIHSPYTCLFKLFCNFLFEQFNYNFQLEYSAK